MALRYPLKTGLIVGFAMFQVGEFAFILASTGMDFALIDSMSYQYFLAISIITMAATPFLIGYSERFSSGMMRTHMAKLDVNSTQIEVVPEVDGIEELSSHLIIIGFGLNGRNTARVARKANVPYLIVDMEPDAVRNGRTANEPIIFGDANNPHILEMLHVYRARVAVIAISDHEASLGIVANIREICKTVHIIVRCKTIAQSEELMNVGASEAISEQFETSIEVFARALNQFLINEDEIDNYVDLIRKDTFDSIRSRFHVYKRDSINFKDVTTQTLVLGKHCPFSDKHLCEVNMLDDNRVRVFGLIRNGQLIKHIDGDTLMLEGDEVILYGRELDLKNFIREWEQDAEKRARAIA
jgi:CPA2 family monovalent cation:H+ antiporter-2